MTLTKHGLKNPIAQEELYGVRGVYNEETGMSGTLFMTTIPRRPDTRFFLTTEHEDVGLVTWYEAPTLEEANEFLDRLKAVQVAKEEVN